MPHLSAMGHFRHTSVDASEVIGYRDDVRSRWRKFVNDPK
jgi:hypothetical protein